LILVPKYLKSDLKLKTLVSDISTEFHLEIKETVKQFNIDYPDSILTLANDLLGAQILIRLLQSSTCTCFEQYLDHRQEVKLY
jgi:hypothetical protein